MEAEAEAPEPDAAREVPAREVLLVLLVAAVVPLFIVLILAEAATQIYTVVTSVESMIDARTIARVNRRQDTARAFKAK